MAKRDILARLSALDSSLAQYADALANEKLAESGEALSRFVRSVGEVDLSALKDDIAFHCTPELANYLHDRIKDVGAAIQQAERYSLLPIIVLDKPIRDAVERARRSIDGVGKKIRKQKPEVASKADRPAGAGIPALDAEDLAILEMLGDSSTLQNTYELESLSTRCGIRLARKTIGKRLRELIKQELADRPKGPNGGVRLTDKGKSLLKTLCPKTALKLP